MPKALVTGGAGFIGSHVVHMLLELGWEVVVFDNLSTGHRTNLTDRTAFVEADIRDRTALDREVCGCAAVFHLAASVGNSRSIADPYGDLTTNAVGTLNVLEACRAAGVRRVVYSSSAGVYGELRRLPIDETHPESPLTLYGLSKLTGERACLIYNDLHGTRNVCLRYFNVYGPRQYYDAYGNVIPIFVTRILGGHPLTIFGDGAQTRDFVNVRDVAAANIAAALDESAHGVFNVGSGTRITVNALVEELSAVAGTPLRTKHAPPRTGDVRDSLADITRARHAFGWTPRVGISEGLQEYVRWARDAGLANKTVQKR